MQMVQTEVEKNVLNETGVQCIYNFRMNACFSLNGKIENLRVG